MTTKRRETSKRRKTQPNDNSASAPLNAVIRPDTALMIELTSVWDRGQQSRQFIRALAEFFDPTETVLIVRAADAAGLL